MNHLAEGGSSLMDLFRADVIVVIKSMLAAWEVLQLSPVKGRKRVNFNKFPKGRVKQHWQEAGGR